RCNPAYSDFFTCYRILLMYLLWDERDFSICELRIRAPTTEVLKASDALHWFPPGCCKCPNEKKSDYVTLQKSSY
ncbi:hypothetical protein CDAR_114871, partial [Caerostris darwini]